MTETPAKYRALASEVQVGGEHYRELPIQPAYFAEKNSLSFLEGCVVKRICRHKKAKGLEDLEKAVHEIRLLAEFHYDAAIK